MKPRLDPQRFVPWALVTGASSGIGRKFASQIAASGINVALVARREALLTEVGRNLAKDYQVQYRAFVLDPSDGAFLERLAHSTRDLDIGLVVSNAGTGQPGEFLKLDLYLLNENLRLNAMAYLNIAQRFGRKRAERKRGGLLLVGAMGSAIGVPFLAGDAAAKAYVHSLGAALHEELRPLDVYVTVLPPPMTDTPVLAKFGFDPRALPMKPMTADCMRLRGPDRSDSKAFPHHSRPHEPHRDALMPTSIKRTMTAKMFANVLEVKLHAQSARIGA